MYLLDLNAMLVKKIRRHIAKTWTDYRRLNHIVVLGHSGYRMSKGHDSPHRIHGRVDAYHAIFGLMAGKSVFTERLFPARHEMTANAAPFAFVSGESTSVALMP